jgi:hypothetical protein
MPRISGDPSLKRISVTIPVHQLSVELRGHVSVSFAISTSHPDLSYIKPECPRHLDRTTKSIYYLFPTLSSWVIEGCSREAIVSGQERTR